MKTKKKALIIALAALLLLTTAVGTMAWLHDKDTEPAQVFTLGDIGINLTYTALDAKVVGIENAKDDVLVPNKTYTLAPTIAVDADSEECYIRMFVKINGWETLKGMLRAETTVANFISNVDTSKKVDDAAYYTSTFSAEWEDEDSVLDTALMNDADGIFEFRYIGTAPTKTVAKSATETDLADAFSVVTLPYYFNNDDIADLVDAGFSIEFEAQAIQADYMAQYDDVTTINEDDAWAAFEAMLSTTSFTGTGIIDNENDVYGD